MRFALKRPASYITAGLAFAPLRREKPRPPRARPAPVTGVNLDIDLKQLLTGPAPKPDWLIPDLFVKGSMVILCGTEGVGKSALGYHMAIALACGLPFLGRVAAPTRTLIMDEENSRRDLSAYIYQAWAGYGRPDVDQVAAHLKIKKGVMSAAGQAWPAILRREAEEHQPGLIIIDTVTPACHIEDENDNGIAAVAAAKLRVAQEAAGPDCSILLYKHLRVDHKSGRMDLRGAKQWKGTVDAVIYHTRSRGHPRSDGLYRTILKPEKVRAFGLRSKIVIEPERVGDGLILHSRDLPVDASDTPSSGGGA